MKKKFKILLLFILHAIIISCGKDILEPGNLVPATVDQDISIPAIEVNNTRLHLETFGNSSNQTIIFLHGGPGTGDFRAFSRMLEEYDGYKLTDEYCMTNAEPDYPGDTEIWKLPKHIQYLSWH